MFLKRYFDPKELAAWDAAVKAGDRSAKPPKPTHVKVIRAKKVQHFSPEFIEKQSAAGLLSVVDGKVIIKTADGESDLVYKIASAPGHYCCHCNLPMEGSQAAAAHVAQFHDDDSSPDPCNPSGYRRDNFYACALVGDEVETPDAEDMVRKVRESFHGRIGPNHREAIKRALAKTPIRLKKLEAADFVFNIAKGSVAGNYQRVDGNDPANSVLVVVIIDANGDTDATMKDRDDLGALLGGTANEVTNTNYARKVLSDSDLAAFSPDDTNDRVDLDIPDQTWTGVAAGTAWTDAVICYDPDSTGGADSAIVPQTLHDFAVTPDGSDITMVVNSAGFFRAA